MHDPENDYRDRPSRRDHCRFYLLANPEEKERPLNR